MRPRHGNADFRDDGTNIGLLAQLICQMRNMLPIRSSEAGSGFRLIVPAWFVRRLFFSRRRCCATCCNRLLRSSRSVSMLLCHFSLASQRYALTPRSRCLTRACNFSAQRKCNLLLTCLLSFGAMMHDCRRLVVCTSILRTRFSCFRSDMLLRGCSLSATVLLRSSGKMFLFAVRVVC